mgnify:CR=1 FL=1
MKSLRELADRAKKKKITLIFSHVNEQPMSVMTKDGFPNTSEPKISMQIS